MFVVIFLPSQGTGRRTNERTHSDGGWDFPVMEMYTPGYHAIILNVNVKYCLLNLRFVCFALSHLTRNEEGHRTWMNLGLRRNSVSKIMNLYLIALRENGNRN